MNVDGEREGGSERGREGLHHNWVYVNTTLNK